MKKISITILIFLCYTFSFAQLHVAWNGNVGIGTTSPECKFQITRSSNSFTFKPNNSGNLEIGGYDGTANSNIIFWHSQGGYNTLTAKSFSRTSDSTLKSDICMLEKPLSVLNGISGYSYSYKEDQAKQGKKEYGVIAQEVERVLPDLVTEVKGVKVVDYDGLIPFLIEAVKEQQTQIASLSREIESIKNTAASTEQNIVLEGACELKVYQNIPNPFNTATTVKCFVPSGISHAQLCIYDTRGSLVKCYDVNGRGDLNIQIQAGALQAGIYVYVLKGDGKTSEAKQMVLTK